jgi:hypothetical protein
MTDLNKMRCKSCEFQGKIDLCKPLNKFSRHLQTKIHGQSTMYYTNAIERLCQVTTSVPCAAHSSIKEILLRDITDETGDF